MVAICKAKNIKLIRDMHTNFLLSPRVTSDLLIYSASDTKSFNTYKITFDYASLDLVQ